LFYSVKLRARQKELLARRKAIKEANPEGLLSNELLSQSPAIAKGGDLGAGPTHSVQELPSINIEDSKYTQLSEAQNSNTDSLSRIDKLSKHKMSSHFDASVSNLGRSLPDIFLPSHHPKGGLSMTNNISTNNLLPVLGLCAPNAKQIESSESNTSKLNWRQNRHGSRQEFPFSLAPCSGTTMDAEVRSKEVAANTKLADASTENLHPSFKNSIPDNSLPFVPVCSLNTCVDFIVNCSWHYGCVFMICIHSFFLFLFCSFHPLCMERNLMHLRIQVLDSLIFRRRWHCQTCHLMKGCWRGFHLQPRAYQIHIWTFCLICL